MDTPPAPPPWYRWHPVLTWPVGGCLLTVVVLRLLPELPLGRWVFDFLQLHLTWPVFLLALGYVFWRIGARRQADSGEATFTPGQATAAGCGVALAAFFLLGVWGAEWPLWWWLVALLVLSAGGFSLVLGWFAYSEVWRTGFNRAVMEAVERQIRRQPDRFIREVERRREGRARTVAVLDWMHRKAEAAPGRVSRVLRWAEGRARRWLAGYDHAWGSPHALAVLEGNYSDARHEMTRAVEQLDAGFTDDRLLDDFVSAGECLAAYLTLNWPDDIAETVAEKRFRVFLDLISAAVWFATPPRRTDFSQQMLGRVPDWLAGLNASTAPGTERFREVFGVIVLSLSVAGRGQSAEGDEDELRLERELVTRILVEYHRLPEDDTPAPGVDSCALIADAWLALADRLDAVVRLDGWEAMTDGTAEPLAVSGSLTATLARAGFVRLTAEVETRTPHPWRAGVGGRRRAAAEWVPAARPLAVRQALARG